MAEFTALFFAPPPKGGYFKPPAMRAVRDFIVFKEIYLLVVKLGVRECMEATPG
jgi:hypothetical protein